MSSIEMRRNEADAVTEIVIRVPGSHIAYGRVTRHTLAIAEQVDHDQFFGMLRDVVNMKMGVELERTPR